MKTSESITDGWIYTYITVPRQIITKENCELIFQGVGESMMEYIEKNKMVVPEGDFVALVGIKFTPEKNYEKRPFATEKDSNADTTFVKGGS